MPYLLHDRYLRIDDERACNLATGNQVRLDALGDSVPPESAASVGAAGFDAVVEALDHGRDGCPRWVVADACTRRQAAEIVERVAAAAVRHGFVAISIETFARFREMLRQELQDRTLFLAAPFGTEPGVAHAALVEASALSPRPHLLLSFRPAIAAGGRGIVREARTAYQAGPSPEVAQLLARASRAQEFIAAGRHASAERLLREVAGGLARRRAFQPAGRLTIALARLLQARGRSDAAIDALAEAVRLAQGAGDDALALEARVWQASSRIADAALVEGESLCRAALAAEALSEPMQVWARWVLAEALFWQGRFEDIPLIDAGRAASGLEPPVVAAAFEIDIQVRLAKGHMFEAGRQVDLLKAFAASHRQPLVDLIASTADLRVLVAAGDLGRGHTALTAALAAARAARSPFRGAWARLAWVEALRRAGHGKEANRHRAHLASIGRVAPLLLRREIARCLALPAEPSHPAVAVSRHSALSVALVRVGQDDDDDGAAVGKLIERLSIELQTSRIDLLSSDAGPVTTVCSAGRGLATAIGTRVLEAAFPIGPERREGGWEIGVPVRFGSRMVGAIACRWPLDRAAPADAPELLELTAAIAAPRLEAWLGVARAESKASVDVPELIGVSDAMADVRKAIVRAASAPFSVLIEGESGVGKELAARAVHHLSPRRERRFCDVNCAALPEDLLESELFGHARGAFSGAVVDRAGLFEEADGGTLFLDEVANLSARAQAKLLRAIQQQEVRRIGESFSRAIDVRLVAAANRDMRVESAAGRFRQDLLYRLDVVHVRIPPLRERPEDIPVLALHCWRAAAARVGSHAELPAAVVAELARYHWPGNVRELQNVIASLAVAAPARGRIRAAMLPPIISAAVNVPTGRLADARDRFERKFIEVALARAGGNRARAARSLGLSRQGLLKMLTRLGLMEQTPGEVDA